MIGLPRGVNAFFDKLPGLLFARLNQIYCLFRGASIRRARFFWASAPLEKMSRPERVAPPDLYYDVKEAGKYTGNSRIMNIQTTMAERCLELLNFGEGESKLILDVGCGSGISGGELSPRDTLGPTQYLRATLTICLSFPRFRCTQRSWARLGWP